MKIAFNPSTVAALTAPPNNKDITFDLRGRNIFARGVKFYGTDTNTWRDIKINNVSIGSHTLDLRNGSNTTLTNTNGIVTINSTWRPVVDNLTSDSTTSSLSAKQGKVLKALIDGKSNSDHNHDGRYVRKSGDTMSGVLIIDTTNFGALAIKRSDDVNGASIQFRGKSNIYGYIGFNAANRNKQLLRWNGTGSQVYTILDTSSTYISGGKGVINGTTITQVDNADKLDGYHANTSQSPFGRVPTIGGDGVMEIGKYIDFHYDNEGKYDYSTRLQATGNHQNTLLLPSGTGTLALTSQIPNKNSWNYDDRYLKLTGGAMVGTINRRSGGSTISGRDHAIIRQTYAPGGSSWNPIACVDTETGTWTLGHLSSGSSNTDFSFCFSTNADYNAGNNNGNYVTLRNRVGTIALTSEIPSKGSWNYDDRYYTKAESNAKYITDITTSVNKLTFTKNGSSIARTITVNNVQSLGKRSPLTERNAISGIYTYGTYSATDNLAPTNYFETLGFGEGVAGTIEIGGSWISGGKLYWRALRDYQENWFSWKTILDSSNYSSILDSRYYTESEVNSLLSKKLDRVNLSVGSWNPRGYHLAADYYYNGGDLSISENGGKMYVSIDGQFYQNEGQYRVLDTSDIGSIRGSLTLNQYLSSTDTSWYPLVWGGDTHKNTNNSTGSLYKSYDKLSWQTSSQTLYATNIRTENIKNLSIGGGIYWNPYVESATDGSDAASITLVKAGIAGGTTLVLSQMNDANDTIQFKTSTAAKLYHNSYPILTTQNTYVDNRKGYIYGTEITQVNNSDTVDGYHADKYIMVPTTIDASALDASTYYPVTIWLPAKNTRIEVEVSLDSGTKPSWSTHNLGFTTRKVWESNGSGWGTTSIERNIFVSVYSFASEDPVRGIGQLINSSIEYVYVRGGGKYFFKISVGGGKPTLQKAKYTTNNQSVAPTKTAPALITPCINTPHKNVTLWGQNFNGNNNVSGTLSGVAHIQFSANNTYDIGSNSNASRYIYTHWLGSKSGANLRLAANNSDNQIVLHTNGNVGIGTNSPSYKLQVNGDIHISHSANDNMSYNTSNPRIVFSENGNQAVGLVYTDYDSYRASKGLKVMDVDNSDTGNVWLEVQGYNYSSGYVKNGSSNAYVLLGGGGHKAESSLNVANADTTDGVHINWSGTNDNPTYLASWDNNGKAIRAATRANITVGNSDKLDGYHENSFLRYRGATNKDQEATLWSQIGIKEYQKALPDSLTGVYNFGSVISLPGLYSRFEIYASHQSSTGNGLYYRSGWVNDKRPWRKFIDSSNIGSQSVNYANSAGSASSADKTRALKYTGTGSSEITAHQTDASYMGRSGWASYIICNHGDGSTYYSQTIAFPFWGSPIYRRLERGTDRGWKKFYTEENPPSWDNVTNKPSSFTPSSHTHSWASITDKIVVGNEFNIVNAGFKESMWFNYLPINDRSKTATISGYHFGNGAKGYASIIASGFIKSGGNASQLLRADGGVVAFNWSGQSGQPTWLWGGNSQHSYYVYNPSNFSVKYAASAGAVAWGNVTGRPSALKNPYSLNVFGVAYDGSAAKTVTTSTFISQVSEATSTITDGTMLITSYASNSGFADTNAVNVPYKRKAVHLWDYIDGKVSTKYLPLAGGTMNANARISHGNGNLYIGRADNNGWVYTQDIASHAGTDKWSIRTSGAAHFGSIYIASKTDTSFNSNVIECTSSIHLNYFSAQDVSLCNGGGKVGIGKSDPLYKLDVAGSGRFQDFVYCNAVYSNTLNHTSPTGYLIIGNKTKEISIRSSYLPDVPAVYLYQKFSTNVYYTANKGFGIRPYYLSSMDYRPTETISGNTYSVVTVGDSVQAISCIIADKANILPQIRGTLIRFLPGDDGQIVLLRDLNNYGSINGYFYVQPKGCNIIGSNNSNIYIADGNISDAYDDGKSRFFIYAKTHKVWIEFYCN